MEPLVSVLVTAVTNAIRNSTQSDSNEIHSDLMELTAQRETSRYSEPIGEDVAYLDNSKSDVEYVKSFHVSKSIERQFKIDQEHSSKVGVSASAGLKGAIVTAAVAQQAEKIYRMSLSDSHLERHVVEHTIEFKMPPRTALKITLKWKRIWQRGEITLKTKSGDVYMIPYQETQGLDYDIETVTSASRRRAT